MTIDKILAYLDTTSRVSCPQITCEQAAEIAAVLRKAKLYEDCEQDGVCAISPGCIRHFLEFNRELVAKQREQSLLAPTGDIDPGIYEGTGKGFEK